MPGHEFAPRQPDPYGADAQLPPSQMYEGYGYDGGQYGAGVHGGIQYDSQPAAYGGQADYGQYYGFPEIGGDSLGSLPYSQAPEQGTGYVRPVPQPRYQEQVQAHEQRSGEAPITQREAAWNAAGAISKARRLKPDFLPPRDEAVAQDAIAAATRLAQSYNAPAGEGPAERPALTETQARLATAALSIMEVEYRKAITPAAYDGVPRDHIPAGWTNSRELMRNKLAQSIVENNTARPEPPARRAA